MRRLSFLVLLPVLLGLVGCAGTRSESPRPASRTEVSSPSARADSGAQARAREAEGSAALEALRAAYIDGAYGEVVRRARRQNSLDTAAAVPVNILRGRAEQARGRHEAAIEALRRVRVVASEAGQSLIVIDRALGKSYVARRRWSQAASAFRRVLEAQPEDRATRQSLAEVYRQSRQWRKAQRQYRRLLRADSSNGRWWARLAQCTLELNAVDRARRYFANAHRHLPRSADIALSLSRLHRAAGHLEQAAAVVDTTLSYQAGDPRLWRRRADLAFQRNYLDRARHAYRRTIVTGDSSATVYRRIGLIDVRRQQYGRALPFLRRSLDRDSTHTRTTLYLGIAYLNLGRLRRATTYLRRTVDREAQGPMTRALEQLGTAHSRRGAVVDAVQAYRTALRLRPDRATVYFHLATTYDEHYRDKRPAARYYRRFLEVSDASLSELRRYAEKRLETLRPTLHMQEEPSATGEN